MAAARCCLSLNLNTNSEPDLMPTSLPSQNGIIQLYLITVTQQGKRYPSGNGNML